jgi:riboflavin synthase
VWELVDLSISSLFYYNKTMFTGIIQGKGKVLFFTKEKGNHRLTLLFPKDLLKGLEMGASVAIDGVCLTVVAIDKTQVSFDVVDQTLSLTTVGSYNEVNLERSLKMGDEVGGHFLSGHVMAKGRVEAIKGAIFEISCDKPFHDYLFAQGFIAIDGISLTVAKLTPSGFQVHLIPETLQRTTLSLKEEGEYVNLEFDQQTVTVVQTIKRMGKGS